MNINIEYYINYQDLKITLLFSINIIFFFIQFLKGFSVWWEEWVTSNISGDTDVTVGSNECDENALKVIRCLFAVVLLCFLITNLRRISNMNCIFVGLSCKGVRRS